VGRLAITLGFLGVKTLSISVAKFPDWFSEPLSSLLTGVHRTTDLGNALAFEWKEPSVSIIFEKSRNPNSQDADLVAMIIRNKDLYVEKAVNFLCRAVGEVDVSDPSFIFRLNSMWEVHFHNALPDQTEGLGALVVFQGEVPTEIQVLDDIDIGDCFDGEVGDWSV
jgi:hypothetical protein